MNAAEESSRAGTRAWEDVLVGDYYDYRWRRIMEPLCDKMKQWKSGDMTHGEMDETLEAAHEEICEARSLFRQRRDRLVNLIQHWDREWFEGWLEKHGRPEQTT